eukprot:CAMPEP_0116549630 /NCGR_PEP_ID=MMETSP0397-20121206/4984_1 /TAXON_ID=216820 /ORGANISM="Cyclophora tenuis, Strain ECT3854" /LENGTH=33 /DNA_ID= /DNA_START= /DNA_END= /DNA_ORIENTATION=
MVGAASTAVLEGLETVDETKVGLVFCEGTKADA